MLVIETEMVLATLSAVVGGVFLGVSCARVIPSAFVAEVSFVVIPCVLLVVHYARKESRPSWTRTGGPAASSASPDAESLDTSASHSEGGSEDSAASAPPPDESEAELFREQPTATSNVPVYVRVEQERRRLGLAVDVETGGAWATAHCLHFLDTSGRKVKYTVRANSKKQRSAVLELAVKGWKPRKSKGIFYDASSRSIRDGRKTFIVPSQDAPLVRKTLALLCKVSSVRLDYADEVMGPRKRSPQSQ